VGLGGLIGGFVTGLGIAGIIGAIAVGIIAFFYLAIVLWNPVSAFLLIYNISGLLALVLYLFFVALVLPEVAGLIGLAGGAVIGLFFGIIIGIIGGVVGDD